MKIKQVVDGKDVIAEVADDTAAFMVERGYATRVYDDVTPENVAETHEVAPSATPTPAPKPEATPKAERK